MTRALLIALTATLLTPAVASAAPPLPVGESDGVTVKRRHGSIQVTFSKRLHKRLAGKTVGIGCAKLPDPEEVGFIVTTGSSGARYRVPVHRRTIGTGDANRGNDYCRVSRPPHRAGKKRVGRRLIAWVPLTQRGAVHLDEQELALGMTVLLGLAGTVGGSAENTYPTYAQFVDWFEREADGAPKRLVALAQPSDTPPARTVGYYGDGLKHAALVTLSASGRRLFIEVSADRTLHTNVAEYLGGDAG
ncbi:MAG: hypothetical protein JW895_09210 [Thermoleophilaceae bacterium]|nr:hypothetical protein [Thermoleophilaceae bacterium]